MFSFTLFTFSGLVLATLFVSKRLEERKKTSVFFLKLISRGDERIRNYHHKVLRLYSEGKELTAFWIKKQLPMRAKNFWNKFIAYIKEISEKYAGNMRNARLLKKSEGISEFFKNISDIEKGNGELHDVYEERAEEITIPAEEIVGKRSTPRKKRIVVIEQE
ncbi:MAG: hypothetical protein HYT69_00315 [Candidatus Zambryskibacteria bacterium]|nr:hypothetical protein [Candidatus Zambryskibacteria bacterium]